MKRALVVIVLLVFVAGVLFLLLEDDVDRRDRRRDAAGTPSAARSDAGRDAAARDAARDDVGGTRARDDDPNRIDGPRLFIRGRVLAKDEPVANARIEILRAPPASYSTSYLWRRFQATAEATLVDETTAAEDGRFEVGVARRTVVVIRARAPGHAPATMRVLVPRAGDVDGIVLRLGEAGTLRGIVVAEDDAPIAGATVTLQTNDYQRAALSYETKTAADGTFTIADLARTNHRVTVRAQGYGATRQWAGLDRELRIVLGAACIIEGRVSHAGGAPAAGVRVRFETRDTVDRGREGRGEAITDETGHFQIPDMQAGYVTRVALEGERLGALSTSSGAIQLEVATTAPDAPLTYDIELPAATAVAGRTVLAEGRAPAPGAHVTLLRLTPENHSLTDVAHTVADAEGRFSFPFVPEGGYAIEAKAAGAARLVRRWMDGQHGVQTDFYADGTTGPAEQVVALVATGTVDGRVLDMVASPTGFNVQMLTEAGQIVGVTDDRMRFRFAHVPAIAETTVSSWNPAMKSEPFAVEAGATVEVVLDAGAGQAFTGVVRDEAGRPVAGASVIAATETTLQWQLRQFLQYGGWGSVATGSDGRFRFPIPEWISKIPHKQKWIVLAKHDGFALGEVTGIKVPEGGTPPAVEVTLRAGGVVSGLVELLGGGPVAGARVTVSPRRREGVPLEKRRSLSATTKADGTFEVRGVEAGTYLASVYHRDGKADGREVTAGATGLRFVLAPTAGIRGVVVDEKGKPLAQNTAAVAAVVPTEKGERRHQGALLDGGRFQILNLEPGAYVLEVSPNTNSGGAQAGFVAKRTELVATGTDDVVISVEPGPRIRGRVFGPDGKARGGVTVIAMPLTMKNSAERRPSGGALTPIASGGGASANITNSRGEFEIRGVSEDQVELVAIQRGAPVVAVKAAAGDTAVVIRMTKGETIEALVLLPDGRPCRQNWFSLQPESKELRAKLSSWRERGGEVWNRVAGWQLTQGQTGLDGRFEMTGLEPGKYRLWLQSSDGVLADNLLETGGGRITLQLLTPFSISGTVTDPAGKPLALAPGQTCYVSAQQGTRGIVGAQVGSDGSFELAGVPGGTITLTAWAPGYTSKSVTVEAGAADVSIALEPAKKKPG